MKKVFSAAVGLAARRTQVPIPESKADCHVFY